MRFSPYIILPILSGVLLALSFPVEDRGMFIWISLVPLLFFIHGASSKRSAFWGSFATGIVFFGITMRWFFDAWPLNWAGIASHTWGLIIIAIVWTLSVAVMALLFGWFGRFTYALSATWRATFGVGAFFVFLEYLRSWIFILPWVGEQTSFGPHWSFATLAYALHSQPFFLSLAPWIGIYGLSFLIVAVNWGIFLFLKNPRRGGILFLIGFIVALSFIPWPNANAVGDKTFALIQTDFSALVGYGLSDPGPAITRLIGRAIEQNPDINVIVLPEGSGWLASLSENFTQSFDERAHQILGEKPYVVIDHARVEENGEFKSRLLYFVNGRGIVASHDKTLLVPGGEYVPYSIAFGARSFNKEGLINRFETHRGFVPGHIVEPAMVEDGAFGGLICSGVVSPTLYSTMTKKGAKVLVSISSDAVFGSSPVLIAMERAMAQLHSAQNQRYFVQAANGGLSYIINEQGTILVSTETPQENIIIGNVKLLTYQSFYARYGSLAPFLFLVISLFAYGFSRKSE